MVSRVLSCLRTLLSAIALLIILAVFAQQPVQANNTYEFTDRTEGDPGDGVLDPALDDSESGGTDDRSPSAVSTAEGAFTDAWYLPLGDFYLVPVYLPGAPMGHGTVIFLPRVWSHTALTTRLSEGRWQHAP